MSIIEQFQKLDDLIFEHTQPPVRTILRNQLALTREQVEAYQASSDRQDETLSAQAQAIAQLQQENKQLVSQKEEAERRRIAEGDETLRADLKKQEEARKRRSLHYD
jgi:hypothetical protein